MTDGKLTQAQADKLKSHLPDLADKFVNHTKPELLTNSGIATDPHPLIEVLTEAAYGRPPVADGGLTVLPALPGPRHCVIGFTAHHVIAAEIDESTIRQRIDPSDLSQPMSAGFLLFLAGWLGATRARSTC